MYHCGAVRRVGRRWNGPIRGWRKCYSVLRDGRVEKVKVTCGSSGAVALDIHHPPTRDPSQPLLIYIPSPIITTKETTSNLLPRSLLTHTTVLTIHLRWSPTHLFPTPIHDTLHAYTWIQTHFLRSLSSTTHPTILPPIAVYGSSHGGTLATSLALTESRPTSQTPTITALATKNTPFDWSVICTTAPPPALPNTPSDVALLEMYSLRSQLFRDPAAASDAFVSPLLFFRTTGLFTPSSFPSGMGTQSREEMEAAARYVARKAHLTFPPKRSGLRLPMTRIAITTGLENRTDDSENSGARTGRRKTTKKGKKMVKEERDDSVLRVQAEEMVRVMQRSVVVHEGKEREEDGLDGLMEAERRVQLVELMERGKDEDGEWLEEFLDGIEIR